MRSVKSEKVLVALILMCGSLLAYGGKVLFAGNPAREVGLEALEQSSGREADQITEVNQFLDAVTKAEGRQESRFRDQAEDKHICASGERHLVGAALDLGTVEGYQFSNDWGGSNLRSSAVALFATEVKVWRSFTEPCKMLKNSGSGLARGFRSREEGELAEASLEMISRRASLGSAEGEVLAGEKDWVRGMHQRLKTAKGSLKGLFWKMIFWGGLPLAVGLCGLLLLVPRALRLVIGHKGGVGA
ncbi:MAG TPA: hypothetical protein VNJ52_04775 [Patescibacteria group bacterium]|nr:hypothetical protein [Patescibacteria group bacterium]